VYRRLRELEKVGLIRSERALTFNKKIYLAERKTFFVGREDTFEYLPFISRPRVAQIAHDLKVTDVRIALERVFPGSRWTPESVLKRQAPAPHPLFDFVPIGDGRMDDYDSGDITVEVECSDKSEARVRKTMIGWMGRKDCELVLYVASTEAIYKRLNRILKELIHHDRAGDIIIALYEDVVTAKKNIPIMTTNGPLFLRPDPKESKGVPTDANRN